MVYRFAFQDDLSLLAHWNHQLIEDEGHRNTMSVGELRERIEAWLAADYRAVLFEVDSVPVAHGLYRETDEEIYLRQFFVDRDQRRKGYGREAVQLLRDKVWDSKKRLKLEVLVGNESAHAFWRSVGYVDYSIAMEIMPE